MMNNSVLIRSESFLTLRCLIIFNFGHFKALLHPPADQTDKTEEQVFIKWKIFKRHFLSEDGTAVEREGLRFTSGLVRVEALGRDSPNLQDEGRLSEDQMFMFWTENTEGMRGGESRLILLNSDKWKTHTDEESEETGAVCHGLPDF